jgi:hypothetical protein
MSRQQVIIGALIIAILVMWAADLFFVLKPHTPMPGR